MIKVSPKPLMDWGAFPRTRLRATFFYLCSLVVLALALNTPAHSQAASATGSPAAGDTQGVTQAFQAAAKRWNVPLPVLMSIGYVESHWAQRDGEPTEDGGYGIMHLVHGSGGTLERAAELTGISEDALKLSADSNTFGGAAFLSYMAGQSGVAGKEQSLSAWFNVVAGYSGSTNSTVRYEYAREVFRVMSQGVSATLSTGEQVTLPSSAVGDIPALKQLEPASDDYGPALWVPANSNNYTVGRPYPPLNTIVIHDTEGSYSSAINWFQNPSSGVSAHYAIRSSDGQITQMVRNTNTAYHTGVWDYNVRALGVEHEGYMSQSGWYTEPMYQASATLVSTLADRYGIKKDRAHIIGHAEIPNQSHRDPGPNWDWTHYMSLVRRDWTRSALVDNSDFGFTPIPGQIDPQHNWTTYGGGYAGSTSLCTMSAPDQASSTNSATWTTSLPSIGYYDVYAFVPYVDNATPDTAAARYKVYAANGVQTAVISQKAITDVGTGSWAHVGQFYFNAGSSATVYLDDITGESGRNVWFDAVMWIPVSGGGPPPTPQATATRTPTRTPAAQPTSTTQAWPTDTAVPQDTPTPEATWTPGPCNMRFTDLPDTSWAYNYVVDLYCRNVVSGFSDGTFRPNTNNSRGQFAKMLVLAFQLTIQEPASPTFSDVPLGSTFAPYVETAARQGIIGGYPDNTFRPNDPVTRAQAVKMIMLAHGWPEVFAENPTFTDIPQTHWAFGYVEGALTHGIIGGYTDGTFRPQSSITRAQVAKTLSIATGSGLP